MSNDNKGVVKFVYEAFGRGDIPAILDLMTPDFRWVAAEHSPYDRGTPYVGPQEVLENIFMKIGAEWDTFTVNIDRYLDAGDSIIVEGRYGGTYKATGKSTHAQLLHIWVIREGKLTEFRQYTDTAALRGVIGKSDNA